MVWQLHHSPLTTFAINVEPQKASKLQIKEMRLICPARDGGWMRVLLRPFVLASDSATLRALVG
jgi:hypothetical protein